jgi:RNA polymerase sigma factor (sigma-70 family)
MQKTENLNDAVAAKARLVDQVLRRLYRSGEFLVLDRDEARSEGMYGLWRGLERYDPARDPRGDLDSYLRYRIRERVLAARRKAQRRHDLEYGNKVSREDGARGDAAQSIRAWRDKLLAEQYREEFLLTLRSLSPECQRVVALLRRGAGFRDVRRKLGMSKYQLRYVLSEIRWAFRRAG